MPEDLPKWDYKLFVPSKDNVNSESSDDLTEYLNKIGDDRWEVVAFWGKSIVAKRERR